MLLPLKQFICDRCGYVIEKPEDGWIEWLHEKDEATQSYKNHGFKIVHHSSASPINDDGKRYGCYHYNNNSNRSDSHLSYFLGENSLVHLYSNLDPGEAFVTSDKLPLVTNMREYVEIMRRLSIPFYEEARSYWSEAKNDGYFQGANELWTYLPRTLKALIEQYGDEE